MGFGAEKRVKPHSSIQEELQEMVTEKAATGSRLVARSTERVRCVNAMDMSVHNITVTVTFTILLLQETLEVAVSIDSYRHLNTQSICNRATLSPWTARWNTSRVQEERRLDGRRERSSVWGFQ